MECLDNQTLLNEILNKIHFFVLKEDKKFYFPEQPQEVEVGNREYKINLDYSDRKPKFTKNILNKKATQMNFRLIEGGGKAIYFIGLKDNGEPSGINLNKLMLSFIYFNQIVYLSNSKYSKIRIYLGKDGYIATIRVFKKFEQKHLLLEI